MIRGSLTRSSFVIVAAALLAACQTNQQVVLSAKSPVELRAIQARAFDMSDRNKALRAIIATLQDLGYNIDKVEAGAGTVTATKLGRLHITATVYARGETQTIVRANALVQMSNQESQVDDPQFYQQFFFEPLAKAMFLAALEVQDAGDIGANTAKTGTAAGGLTPNAQ